MSMSEALSWSRSNGRWSFALTPPATAFQQESLLQVDVDPIFSRVWTVHLNEWRFSSGTIVTGRPPQNQLDARFMNAVVTWGVDGALETARVDYPGHGCTFTVQGANVRVGISADAAATPGVPIPNLSGFIVPAQSWRAYPTQSPTFTPVSFVLPNNTNVLIPIPARAVAYRWFTNQEIAVGGVFTTTQIGRDGAAVIRVDEVGAVALGDRALPSNAADYYPLHKSTQFIFAQFANVDPSSFAGGLQFLLDLG